MSRVTANSVSGYWCSTWSAQSLVFGFRAQRPASLDVGVKYRVLGKIFLHVVICGATKKVHYRIPRKTKPETPKPLN